MRILESFVASPLAGAIGWTLLHSLWEGAAISAILAMVLISTRSPRVRYAAACAAMLAVVAAFGVTLFRLMPDAAQSFPRFRTFGSLPPLLAFAPQPSAGHSWMTDLSKLAPWLAPLWIVGAFVLSLQRVTSWLAAQTLRRRGVCFASEEWHAELARFAMRLRIFRPVHLLESCFAEVPMVLGHLRPVILMPVGLLANLPVEQVETILLHELAHIRRCDYLVNVLQRFVEGLLFYHPAIWWISKIMRTERENCCDDVVISVGEQSHEYALALAAVERNRLSHSEAAVAATGGSLVKRIRRLLYPKAPPSIWAPALAAAILAVTAAVSIAAAKAKPSQLSSLPQNTVQARTLSIASSAARPSAEGQSQAAAAQTDSYSKWLNEDVVYIITPEERDTFLRFNTDEERDQFIKVFWERRNPNPGSADNPYKDEIYRRIDYTNQHFATSATPGWKTDRGRIYIIWGKPDEVESHKAGERWNRPVDLGGGTATMYAYEDWRYRYLEGFSGQPQENVLFEFVDATGTGDFHLAMSPNEKDAEPLPNGRSQETSPSNANQRIVTQIYFNGYRTVDRDTILNKIATRTGDVYNAETLARDFQALYNTHLFSDIRMEKSDDPTNPNGIIVTFHLTERQPAQGSSSGPQLQQGRLVSIEGKVQVKKANSAQWNKADLRMTLDKGDQIQTGPDGMARVAFADSTQYTVKGNTLVTVEENGNAAIQLQPRDRTPISLKANEDSIELYQTIAALAGLKVEFDPSFTSQRLSINLVGVTIEQALDAVSRETGNKWKAIASDAFSVAPANAEQPATEPAAFTVDGVTDLDANAWPPAASAPEKQNPPAASKPARPLPVNVQILGSTEGVDFSPYINETLKSIQSRWMSLIPQDAYQGKSGKVTVILSIKQNGKLSGPPEVSSSAGAADLDKAVVDAVSKASLNPLPKEFHGPQLKLGITFFYNEPAPN